jgi:Flp pilus assembly protein TadD
LVLLAGCAAQSKKEELPPPKTPREALERRITELQQAAAADAGNPSAQYTLGNALFDVARYVEAKDAYQAAIRLKPDYAEAYCNMGLCLRLLGQIDDSIAAYDRALELQPDEQTTLTNLIAAMRTKGDANAAETHLRKLAELRPNDVLVHSELANILFRRGDFAAAAAEFNRVIELDPGMSDDYYNLGACYMQLDDLDEAMTTWLTALAYDAKNASVRKGLAVLYWKRGDFDKAWEAVVDCQTRGIPVDAEFLANLQRDSGQAGPESAK